uniref:Peroxisomal biogenesis factor 19 n=1 Tax=Apteryx owenii TaxID=8824 RepID=A0A8B9S3Y8_APTOW
MSPGALDDFEKARPAAPPPPAAGDAGSSEKSPSDAAKESLFASQEKFFQDLFDSELASQATAEFEKAMKELAEEEPHLVEQFQKLSEAAGRVELHCVGGRAGQRQHPAHHAEHHAKPAVQRSALPLSQGDHGEGEGLGLGLARSPLPHASPSPLPAVPRVAAAPPRLFA